MLVDCITLLVSNVVVPLDRTADLSAATAAVEAEGVDIAYCRWCGERAVTCIVVSNEVGLGLVPDTPLGRVYRDLLDAPIRYVGARSLHAQAVYFMVAGLIAINVKALALHRESLEK